MLAQPAPLQDELLRALVAQRRWAVVAEAMQTILRREGYPKPYEALKALTRTGGPITHDTIRDFVAGTHRSTAAQQHARKHAP